uniref:Uncharacterized protein n=1 Tax=Lactuca sativa TaxID=4236 RepID=A0A9R1UQL8_LACSA|nr:hypothetical protein LSAT_V11C800422020 [Lactuca sativa]
MGWVHETDSEADAIAKGWVGVHEYLSRQKPEPDQQWHIEVIEMLHENEVSFQNKKLEGGSLHEIQGITASQLQRVRSVSLAAGNSRQKGGAKRGIRRQD